MFITCTSDAPWVEVAIMTVSLAMASAPCSSDISISGWPALINMQDYLYPLVHHQGSGSNLQISWNHFIITIATISMRQWMQKKAGKPRNYSKCTTYYKVKLLQNSVNNVQIKLGETSSYPIRQSGDPSPSGLGISWNPIIQVPQSP